MEDIIIMKAEDYLEPYELELVKNNIYTLEELCPKHYSVLLDKGTVYYLKDNTELIPTDAFLTEQQKTMISLNMVTVDDFRPNGFEAVMLQGKTYYRRCY